MAMGIAYAWEKMSMAVDALATAPEALPARLEHALFPHFLSALDDAEQGGYMPEELLAQMRRVRDAVGGSGAPGGQRPAQRQAVGLLDVGSATELAQRIVDIAHEVRRQSTL